MHMTATAAAAAARPMSRRRRSQSRPWVALAAIIAGAGAVILLWIQDTPYVNGLADWLTNAGRHHRLAGRIRGRGAAGLMARIPALERGSGRIGWLDGMRWVAATRSAWPSRTRC